MKVFRFLEIAAILLLAGLGVWQLVTRPLDDRLDAMLPQDPALLQSMKLLEDARLSGKVIVQVQSASPDFPHETFVEALDALAARLRSPLISRVVTPADAMPTPEDLREFSTFSPQLLGPSTYPALEQRVAAEGVEGALKSMRRTLMTPQSMALASWFRSDPLGARATALQPLQSLGLAVGYRMNIRSGHFFSEDLGAAMLILETPVRITDHAGSAELIAFIRAQLERLPSGLKGSVVAGHLHTLSNQRVIRRDIGWTSTLASIFFAALFLIHFRDLRSVLIFIIPTLGILMGIAILGFTGARVVAIVVGMCGMLAGIAIDYGIHVYVALSRPEVDRSRDEALRLISRTIWLSALTTIAPIAGLVLSTIPGYRQLGLLSSLALLFSLLLALRALPLFFPENVKAASRRRADPPAATKPLVPPRRVIAYFVAILLGGVGVAMGVRVDLDFARLDGTEASILQEEESFFKRWGGGPGSMGIVAVWDRDPEKARQANDVIYEQIRRAPGVSDSFFSMASVHPSEKTRRENAARWVDFWNQHAAGLRGELARVAPGYGFASNAFEPFFLSLYDGTDASIFAPSNRLLSTFEQQFARANDDRYILLSFFADNPPTRAAMANLRDIPSNYACISRAGLQETFSACIIKDLSRQAIIGLSLISLVVVILVRRARVILVICIPPVTGVVGMLAGLRLAGEPLTPVTMMAGLMLAGNCFDYGVFMMEAWRRNARDEIGRGVYLAWITTVAGSALLLVTKHPVLYATGLALTIGLTCGFFSARWVIWSAAQLLRVPTNAESKS